MRRFLFGLVVATAASAAPGLAIGGDREVADAIFQSLKEEQAAGKLKGFDIDLSVEDGEVVFTGSVASDSQLNTILTRTQHVEGVARIINRMTVKGKSSVQPASGIDLGDSTEAAGYNEPATANRGVSRTDAAITDHIIGLLSDDKAAGVLRGFNLDVSTVDGEVWVRGNVADSQQKNHVLSTVQKVAGVSKVIDDVTVAGVQQASGQTVVGSSMPVVGEGRMAPQAFAPSMLTSGSPAPNYSSGGYSDGGYGGGAPMPMSNGPSYGPGVPRYDQPNMPNYAWPSYAAAPNYAAVTYPKQYSASAWPYIGPFYPYPQVPLGWRKVSLEWDDGLWYLDFTSK